MRKLNVAYIGNCSEEFSGVLDSFYGDISTVATVCDTEIKRGLICVEKYLCNFVEDYHVIVSQPDMSLVVVESCDHLRQEEICATVEAGKNIFVILSEKTLMQMEAVEKTIREAKRRFHTRAVFVTVDELDNDFWFNLPVTPQDIGPLLNVVVGVPSRAPGSVSLERNAYDAVRTLYELLGEPTSCLGVGGPVSDQLYTGAASFRYASGAIAAILIGGTVRGHTVCIYGENGCAEIARDNVRYQLKGGVWTEKSIIPQKRRTRKPTFQLLQTIHNNAPDDHSHSLDEVLVTGRMLRAVLDTDA